jgi:hypothetical protein
MIIDTVFLSDFSWKSEKNPRGWNPHWFRSLESFTPDVLEQGRQYADRAKNKHKSDGVLVWDIEGQEHRNVNYVGDPRFPLCPEMQALGPSAENILDEGVKFYHTVARNFFMKFYDAGLRVGGTLRPTSLVMTPYGPRQEVGDSFDILDTKVEYAKRVLNWSLVYLDTVGRGADDANLLQRLARKYPDVLFIPEFSPELPRNIAPMMFANPQPYWGKPTQDFVYLKPEDTPTPAGLARLTEQVKRGGIASLLATWDWPGNDLILKAIVEAKK